MTDEELKARQEASDRLVEIGKRIIHLNIEWPTMPPDVRRSLMAAHREAWMQEAGPRGVPPDIAELQWRDIYDRERPLTAVERHTLTQWNEARAAESETLKERIDELRARAEPGPHA